MPAGRTRQQQVDLLLTGQRKPPAPSGRHRRAPLELARTVRVERPIEPPYASRTAAEIRALAEAADVAIYGPDDPSDDQVRAFWGSVDAVRRSMLRRYGRRRRLLIRLSPGSLRPPGRAGTPTIRLRGATR
jgi:hypothetical protein